MFFRWSTYLCYLNMTFSSHVFWRKRKRKLNKDKLIAKQLAFLEGTPLISSFLLQQRVFSAIIMMLDSFLSQCSERKMKKLFRHKWVCKSMHYAMLWHSLDLHKSAQTMYCAMLWHTSTVAKFLWRNIGVLFLIFQVFLSETGPCGFIFLGKSVEVSWNLCTLDVTGPHLSKELAIT